MKLTCIIIDDELSARSTLIGLLKEFCPEVEILGTADSAASGAEILTELNPDLVFLDIEMPAGNGFQMLEAIPEKSFELIFTTAYDQYAMRAIKACALDYLLKPIDVIELMGAVEKVKTRKPDQSTPEQFRTLLENLDAEKRLSQKLIIPGQEGLHIVKIKEIICCTGDRNYTRVKFRDGRKLIVSKTLRYFEEILPEPDFFRVHKSFLINMHEVVMVHKLQSGVAGLSDGTEVDISRSKKEEFLRHLQNLSL